MHIADAHWFWARVKAGRAADGTAGVTPKVVYGNSKFSASARGSRPSPTTGMRKACVTVCGAGWVVDGSEHRSSKCCSACGHVLKIVKMLTPVWRYIAAARKGRRRPRRLSEVRGLRYCPQCHKFVHRDGDAALLIRKNKLSIDKGRGTLPCMRQGARPWEAPAGVFEVWPS